MASRSASAKEQVPETTIASRSLALAEHTEQILKFKVIGGGSAGLERLPESQVLSTYERDRRLFEDAGAIAPPYNPQALCILYEHSNALQPNVAAMRTNVHGFGFQLVPSIDLSKRKRALETVADAIFIERERNKRVHPGDPQIAATNSEPTPDEIKTRLATIKSEMRREKLAFENFFATCAIGMSFSKLRQKLGQDEYVIGNAFMEITRSLDGAISRFGYVLGSSVRLLPEHRVPVDVISYRHVSRFTLEKVVEPMRFRRFVQVVNGEYRYFKQFRDPRVMSAEDGKFYPTMEKLPKGHHAATELFHLQAIGSTGSSYGVPLWSGVMPEILGNRSAAEGNYFFFENGTLSGGLICVQGDATIPDAQVDRIERKLNEEMKGKDAWGKFMVMQALPASSPDASPAKISVLKLTQQPQTDALFSKYDESNIEKVGQQFRLPPQLRGKMTDANRANSDAALASTEQQVFGPDREFFDSDMDLILLEMGMRYHKFRSNAPTLRNPVELAKVLIDFVRVGIMVPNEARAEAAAVLNHELAPIDAPWAEMPLPLALAEKQNLGNILTAGPDAAADAGVQQAGQEDPLGDLLQPGTPDGIAPGDEGAADADTAGISMAPAAPAAQAPVPGQKSAGGAITTGTLANGLLAPRQGFGGRVRRRARKGLDEMTDAQGRTWYSPAEA